MQIEATTQGPAETGADTIVVGVFDGEDIAHDVDGGLLQKLLDRGEARRAFRRLAVVHHDDRRYVIVGLGARDGFDTERARVVAATVHGRARELSAHTLCWEVPHHLDDAHVGALATIPTTTAGSSGWSSPPTTRSTARSPGRRRWRRRRTGRATCRTRPPTS
jgi:leucyl aminopeptidase